MKGVLWLWRRVCTSAKHETHAHAFNFNIYTLLLIENMFKWHFTNPHSCVEKTLNINEGVLWLWCVMCVCVSQTCHMPSCAGRPTAPQTLRFDQVLAGLRRKWFLCQCAEHTIANAPRHAFVLPSFLWPHRPGASSFAVLWTWQKWHLCQCETANPPAPPAQWLCIRCKIGPKRM